MLEQELEILDYLEFQTPTKQWVNRLEYSWVRNYCIGLFMSTLLDNWQKLPLKSILVPDSQDKEGRWLDFELRQSVDNSKIIKVGDNQGNLFDMALNTALVGGSDPVKLLARIIGQDYIFIQGKNRDWFAEILEDGRRTNILRPIGDWEQTITLIKVDKKEPVVAFYNQRAQFPNMDLAVRQGIWTLEDNNKEEQKKAWDRLKRSKAWNLSFQALKKENNGLSELTPLNWAKFRFVGSSISAFDLRNFYYQYYL